MGSRSNMGIFLSIMCGGGLQRQMIGRDVLFHQPLKRSACADRAQTSPWCRSPPRIAHALRTRSSHWRRKGGMRTPIGSRLRATGLCDTADAREQTEREALGGPLVPGLNTYPPSLPRSKLCHVHMIMGTCRCYWRRRSGQSKI
ncbi:hypothetical protein SKAU_G00226750 [Synaphobranchus kaupii]|uniref:Uncharacterized protein n=1 Tax=Synaphobranchus kaupii TaxID=118154 RepID=A0A9Q1F4T8_SYNKA|nr:hypothetical protein SKAU_G00226750 [Synaphobranchus kaupii]